MAVLNSVVMNILNCRLIRALKSPKFITLLEKQSLICMDRQAELGMAIQTDRLTGGKLDYLMYPALG